MGLALGQQLAAGQRRQPNRLGRGHQLEQQVDVALDAAFVVVVGHGQFIRGYLLGRSVSFQATPDWMRAYRADETARPMANCEIVELSSEDWAGTN